MRTTARRLSSDWESTRLKIELSPVQIGEAALYSQFTCPLARCVQRVPGKRLYIGYRSRISDFSVPSPGIAESVGERIHHFPQEASHRPSVERNRQVGGLVARVVPFLIVEQAVDVWVRFAVESTVETV